MKLTEKVEAWLNKSNDFEYLFQQFNLEFGPRPNSLDKLPPQVSMINILLQKIKDYKSYKNLTSKLKF